MYTEDVDTTIFYENKSLPYASRRLVRRHWDRENGCYMYSMIGFGSVTEDIEGLIRSRNFLNKIIEREMDDS